MILRLRSLSQHSTKRNETSFPIQTKYNCLLICLDSIDLRKKSKPVIPGFFHSSIRRIWSSFWLHPRDIPTIISRLREVSQKRTGNGGSRVKIKPNNMTGANMAKRGGQSREKLGTEPSQSLISEKETEIMEQTLDLLCFNLCLGKLFR